MSTKAMNSNNTKQKSRPIVSAGTIRGKMGFLEMGIMFSSHGIGSRQ